MKKLLTVLLCLTMLLSTVPAMGEDALTLDLWTIFTGDDGATLQKLVDEFNASHEGITVNHSPMAAADLYTKLPLAVQTAANIPDLCIIHVERLPRLIDEGYLTSGEFLFENGVRRENYRDWVLDLTNFGGVQYGIPWDFFSGVVYVNPGLVEKYGLASFVEDGYLTFDEVLEVGAIVEATGDAVKTINYYGGAFGFLGRYAELGGDFVGEDGGFDLDTDAFVRMFEKMREINERGYAIGQNDDAKTMFIGNELIFWEVGTHTTPALVSAGVDFYQIPLTCFAPETAVLRFGSHTFAMPEDEERTLEEEAAIAQFIDWMGANSMPWSTEAGQLAQYQGILESEAFKALPQAWLIGDEATAHAQIFNIYYWDLLETAIGQMGKDPIYNPDINLEDYAQTFRQGILDAIAQQ